MNNFWILIGIALKQTLSQNFTSIDNILSQGFVLIMIKITIMCLFDSQIPE